MRRILIVILVALLASARATETKSEPLFLTPYISSGQLELARNLSAVGPLPGAGAGPGRPGFSGLITVDTEQDSHLFFWFFPAINRPESAPVLLWLDGGPGVSNFISIFNQNGPYIVTAAGAGLDSRPSDADWTRNYSIVYVDSPVGTGFSFTGSGAYPATSEENAIHLLTFVRQFRLLFPVHATPSTPWHLVGESYGGHIAPALAALLDREAPEVDLKGVLLIVPWVNPTVQVGGFDSYLHELGLIDSETRSHFQGEQIRIQGLVDTGDLLAAKEGFTSLVLAPNSTFARESGFSAAFNVLQDQPDLDSFAYAVYALQPEFKAAVHVGVNATFNLVSPAVQEAMAAEFMESKAGHVEGVLDNGLQVTLVAGQLDLTVTHTAVEAMAEGLRWEGADEFKEAERRIWRTKDGRPAGYSRKARNLEYVLLRNAGHILLADAPHWGLELVAKIIPRDNKM